MSMKSYLLLLLLSGQTFATLNLTQISFNKIHGCPNDNGALPNMGMFNYGAVRGAFENNNRMLYVIGRPPSGSSITNGCVRVFTNLENSAPYSVLDEKLEYTDDGELLSIATCSDMIAMSFSALNHVNEGHVRLFQPVSLTNPRLVPLDNGRIVVGPYPKHMAFTDDCNTLVVANEGIPGVKNNLLYDPEGEISVLTRDQTGSFIKRDIRFEHLNGDSAGYQQRGVRYVYRGEPGTQHTFSRDIEPEFVAINPSGTKAYVTLQENNAVAVIDLTTHSLEVHAFPLKNWTIFQLDASDRDKTYSHGHYNLLSLHQPKVMLVTDLGNGVDTIITANTGARKEFNFPGYGSFTEGERLQTVYRDNQLDTGAVGPDMISAIQDLNRLGRLYVSQTDGLNFNGLVEKIHFFGSRDLSMLSSNSSGLYEMFSTGSDLEASAARDFSPVFNGDTSNANYLPSAEMDTRSDDMGPEPRALTGGYHGMYDMPFVITGTRNGILYVYAMRGGIPKLDSLFRLGRLDDTWANLYSNDNTDVGDNLISDIGVMEKGVWSINPFIYVLSEASGTLSVYEVIET